MVLVFYAKKLGFYVHDYGKNDRHPDDSLAQLSERIYSKELTYNTRNIENRIGISSVPFIKKSLLNSDKDKYCADLEADNSTEEYGKPYKFDECKLVNTIDVGFDHTLQVIMPFILIKSIMSILFISIID